jgi:hypothetical protein
MSKQQRFIDEICRLAKVNPPVLRLTATNWVNLIARKAQGERIYSYSFTYPLKIT